ncbi:MAG TPA: hypothetical protein VFP91_20520 [Vicinamibacterales bacterium]|nr:hypothetical protein [Vicinamibacterales bacterium]
MRLVRRLLPSQDIEALLGDIAEEGRCRSRVWYWAQIAALLVIGSWKDFRAHKLLAVRAAIIGIATTMVLIEAQLLLRDVATGAGFTLGTTWIGFPSFWHYPYEASWSYRAFIELEFVLSTIASGWIVVCSHRRHGVTMAVAFVAGLTTFRLANLATVPGPIVNFPWWAFAQRWLLEATLILLGGCFATKPLEHS